MALDFPNTGLTVGLEYTGDNGVTYVYDGEKWVGRAPAGNAGTNSIINGDKVVQIDGDGNLVIPVGSVIKDADGTQYGGGGNGFQLTSSTAVVSLAADGTLTFPNGSTIGASDPIFGVPITTTRGTIFLGNQAECLGGENHFHIMKEDASAVDLFFGDDLNYVKLPGDGGTHGVEIGTNTGTANLWRFGTDGTLTFPNGAGFGLGESGQLKVNDSTTLKLDFRDNGGRGFYTNEYGVTIRSDGDHNFTFGTDGYMVTQSLYLQGYLKGVDGSTGSTGQVLTRQNNGGVAWADSTGGGGAPDGGLADNTAGLTITTSTLATDYYDNSGSVTFNIRDAGATTAGIIIKGLTVNHTQTITSDTYAQGDNTVAWGSWIASIDYQLWEQMVSITAYAVDSRGYTFYAVVTDMWDVPHGPCLVEGTQVTMSDGTHKAIEDIQHGELVRVWNFDLGEFSEAQPLWVKAAEETTGYDVYTFSDGTKLRTVGHHVFNKQAGAFTKLKYAETPIGTTTFNEHGEEVTLLSKERVTAPTRYYNVWTQYHLNLFADGILTSNRFNNIYPIVDMKFVKDNRVLRDLEEFTGIDEKYITGLRLQEQSQEYTAEYISNYVHNRLERLDIANTVEQGN